MKHLTLIAMIFTLAAIATADYHYASHEGSNEYPYTSWETAADSIQKAVDAASPHDTVYIGAGDYNETIRVPNETTNLGLIGMGQDSTRIWYECPAGLNMVWVVDSAYVRDIKFENSGVTACLMAAGYLDINNCKFTGEYGIVGYTRSANIENCIFDNIGDGGISYIFGESPFIIVRNCLITNSGGSALFLAGHKVIVENCIGNGSFSSFFTKGGNIDTLIINNNFSHDCNWAYLTSISSESSVLNNNVSINDGSYWEPAFYLYYTYSGLIYNNSITNNYTGIWLRDANESSWIDLRYNNIKCGLRDIEVDYDVIDTSIIYHEYPMFVDPDNLDFHLQAFSPLIDAGHPDILDVDGTRSDIGCYGGPGGCSYTYLDLAPLIPDSIQVSADSLSITLVWHMNEEADFNRYQIFRDTTSGFEPTIFDMIAEPETSHYEDTDIEPGAAYYYRLTSVDNQGNVSDFSEEVAVIPTSIPSFLDDGLPQYTVIERAYPNPSNSNVTIVYSASNLGPQPPEIKLQIFDIQGRVVKILVNDRIPMGTYRAVWDGTNDNGEPVASGTYIARVFQWGQSAGDFPVKITLIK